MVVLCYLLADLLMAEVQSLKCTNLYAAQELCRKVLSKKCLNATEELALNFELCEIVFSLGSFPKALAMAEMAAKSQNINDEMMYKFSLLLGHIHRAMGKLEMATTNYQNAKEVALKVDAGKDCSILAHIYEQLCVYAGGDNKGPLNHLQPLLQESRLHDDITLIVLHQALGNVYRSAADWHNSTTHFKTAIQVAKRHGHISRVMECKGELGRAYRSSGCHSKALKRQEKFLKYAQSRGDTANVANACGYIGFTYYSMGKQHYEEAVKYLYTKLQLSRNELDDSAGYRWCLNNIGKVYLGLKEYNTCIKLFVESSKIAKDLGNMLGLGTAYGNLGSAYRAVGKHNDAVNCHLLYLEIAQKTADTGGVAIMQRELILDHLYLYRNVCDAEKRESFLAQAGIYAFKALKTSLEVRSRLQKEDDMLKISNFEHNQAKIYSLLLFIVIEQGQYEAGLVLSELGRAHALADKINDKFEVNSSFLSDVFAIIGSNDEVVPSALSTVINKLGRLIHGFNSHLLAYSLVENPLDESKVKQSLLYIWHVQGTCADHAYEVQVHFKQSVINLNLDYLDDSSVTDYISSLIHEVQMSDSQTSVSQAQSTATSPLSRDIIRKKVPTAKVDKFEELYGVLIGPMSQYIYTGSQGARLVIIPHGFLFGVPFCALKKCKKYLIEDFIISLSPSLYILDIGLQREIEWSKLLSTDKGISVLAIGNPKMPLDSIEPLPGAEREVNSIASLLKDTKLLCGESATKKAVLKGFGEYSVIHLATHAIVETSLEDIEVDNKTEIGDYSMKGAIILAQSDSKCSGVLTSSEIGKLCLKPSCELVVLSCCKTGRGKITGDGILGLSRSLMCAGVMNMLVTHWPILDESTSLLVKQFYNHYAVSRDAPAALQHSMSHLIANHYSVKQWAPFCCFGKRYSK